MHNAESPQCQSRRNSIYRGCSEGLTKQQIRSKILLKLKLQKEENREKKSNLIKDKLFRSTEFIKAKRVMFYIAFDGEVNTANMIKEAKKLGKIVAVPVCAKGSNKVMPCLLSDRARLKKGPYGVLEPAIKKPVRLEDADLVIVPGVAFDREGRRLGRGKGCYDSLLKELPCNIASIGLAFDFQILPDIPATATDRSVDRVLFA
ncbi:MAG: 5-formyltetrahydrofolate cyclo-ligase [Candidatus Omnitrophica bacterium]|nr:5-formyltetrahydrofolate cyclo-ligase [Candidatus Omnitrophota bacterium]